MFSYIQVSVLAVVALSANAIPIEQHELSSATSYSSSNHGYQGYDDGLSHLGNLGGYDSSSLDFGDHELHVSPPVVTQHVLTPIVKKVPVLIKHETIEHEEEHYEPKKYEFHYAVEDKHTGDIKSQKEVSDGHVVQGEYSLKEADGTTRVVKYSADKKNGFNAVVIRKGHAAHPQVVQKKDEVKKLFVPIVDHHDNYQQIYSHY